MTDLTSQHCIPRKGSEAALSPEEIRDYLKRIDEAWTLETAGPVIQREFAFDNFHQTMAFANAVAWIAHHEDHHPDLELSYKRCKVTYTTHSVDGLSLNDFICAAKIDALIA